MNEQQKTEWEVLKKWLTDNNLRFYVPDFWSVSAEFMAYSYVKNILNPKYRR
jgi:hypothetical protein